MPTGNWDPECHQNEYERSAVPNSLTLAHTIGKILEPNIMRNVRLRAIPVRSIELCASARTMMKNPRVVVSQLRAIKNTSQPTGFCGVRTAIWSDFGRSYSFWWHSAEPASQFPVGINSLGWGNSVACHIFTWNSFLLERCWSKDSFSGTFAHKKTQNLGGNRKKSGNHLISGNLHWVSKNVTIQFTRIKFSKNISRKIFIFFKNKKSQKCTLAEKSKSARNPSNSSWEKS